MTKPLLTDSTVFPDSEVLKTTLRETYSLYATLIEVLEKEPYGFNAEWRYYKDGNAWLCKITLGKNTIIWLSAWDGFFKCSLYFNVKYEQEVEKLDINPELITIFRDSKTYGKLKALSIDVSTENNLNDVLTATNLKMKLK